MPFLPLFPILIELFCCKPVALLFEGSLRVVHNISKSDFFKMELFLKFLFQFFFALFLHLRFNLLKNETLCLVKNYFPKLERPYHKEEGIEEND